VAITWKSAADLYSLCDELKVDAIRSQVEAFLMNKPGSISDLISVVLSLLEKQISTSFLEPRLQDQLDSLIGIPAFSEIPLSVLDRVIDFGVVSDRSSFRRLLEFCLAVVDRCGVEASILFRTLDPSRLTGPDISLIGSSRRFIYDWMPNSAILTLIDSRGFQCETEVKFQQIESNICALKRSIESMEGTCVQMSAFASLRAQFEDMK
jgi:hypothetical protein